MLSTIDNTRLRISVNTEAKKKSHLGQFLTPSKTAQYMASLFYPMTDSICRLLDPGAGIGSLTSAFLERCVPGDLNFKNVEVTAFEIDNILRKELENTFVNCLEKVRFTHKIISNDFIEEAVNKIQFDSNFNFSHAILNPPYKKIKSNSHHRSLLRQVGIESVNLYSAFVTMTLALMAPKGQVVAIIPRSFCNGPYYLSFRKFILEHAAIRKIHLFKSRNTTFKDDGVLQENIIIMFERDGQQGDIKITTSTDDSLVDFATNIYPFDRIVFSDDPQRFIRIPTSPEKNPIELSSAVQYSLEELGIQVSTGPVVDFRLKEYLRDMPEPGTVPLLYPGHFKGQDTEWPKADFKKANAILQNVDTEKWLFATGFYCVIRRFSSKEEKRRIVASVVQPKTFPNTKMLAFENHLNVFHKCKNGLPEILVRGLAMFLNSTAVDKCFRSFNGHTQINATDLKLMKYPSREMLMALGKKAKYLANDQQSIDNLINSIL